MFFFEFEEQQQNWPAALSRGREGAPPQPLPLLDSAVYLAENLDPEGSSVVEWRGRILAWQLSEGL